MSDQDQAYIGQARYDSTTSKYNRSNFQITSLINQIVTMTLVQVVAVSNAGGVAAAGTVDVQPLVAQVNGSGQATPHDIIYGMPYIRMQGGANALILDPQVGDIGLAGFCMRDISAVKATLALNLPGSGLTYDWADGIYIGLILNGVPKQYVQFTQTGINIQDMNDNKILMESDGVKINSVLIDRAGNLGAPGEITRGVGGGDSVTLGGHNHTQPNDSHGDTEMPTAAPTAGT